MRIAIVGAGFSGLAVCWNLIQQGHSDIIVFDKKGIGSGASGMAAGLLHPYAGSHSKLNWLGKEGLEATKRLLKVAEEALGVPVADLSGILRIAVDEGQLQDYQRCASLYPDVKWMEASETAAWIPGLVAKPGIWIKEGISVDCSRYLQGLWRACEAKGVLLKKEEVLKLGALDRFDLVIVAAGAGFKGFTEFAKLPLGYVKGQLLEFAWPTDCPTLPLPINSYVYLVKHATKPTCIAGATFERSFAHTNVDLELAKKEIVPHIQELFPGFGPIDVLDCQAGIRVTAPQHRPFYKQINDRVWVLTGMGSKGLLYHALFAEKLVKEIAH